MIADHIYGKYDVFKRFKPLALGIDQDLIAALPQYDAALIARVLANPLPPSALSERLSARRQTFRCEQPFQRRSYPPKNRRSRKTILSCSRLCNSSPPKLSPKRRLLKPKQPNLPQQNKSPNEMPSENRFGFRRHFSVYGNHGSNIEFRRIALRAPSRHGGRRLRLCPSV